MNLAPLLLKIDTLQQTIEAKGLLDETVKKRIHYKFRLDWNYYSNAMEGNSLTKQETRSVMMNNITINGKPMRDVLEVKGHNEAVLEILKISKSEVRLSEKRIKELHKAIIHEEDPEKVHQVGEWKTQANYLLNVRNERFDFLAPELVPDAMHELLNKTNAQIDAYYHSKKESWHPAVIAFYFHLEYVKIHPFYDGNGRTARLLMNLLLISFGFPPVILNLENKERYYSLLTDIQGYGGNPDLFYEFMSGLLIQSQEMVLDAIDGKDISGEDDLDKEIAIWKKQLVIKDEFISRSDLQIANIYIKSIKDLFTKWQNKLIQFDDLFASKETYFQIDNKNVSFKSLEDIDYIFNDIIYYSENPHEDIYGDGYYKNMHSFTIRYVYNGYKNDGVNTFTVYSKLLVRFYEFNYSITNENDNTDDIVEYVKLYSQLLNEEEIRDIVNKEVSKFFMKIKSSIKNNQ